MVGRSRPHPFLFRSNIQAPAGVNTHRLMARKQWMLIAVAVFLGGISLYLNRDWFAKENIQIYSRSRPARAGFFAKKRATDPGQTDPIFFDFDRRLKLTSVKVIAVSDAETNKYPHAFWHLVSDSNSVPTKDFVYGMNIRGMRPEVKGATADPLEPGSKYRLLVEAGSIKAEHEFVAMPRTR